MNAQVKHEPVMVHEVIERLHIKKGGKYIDATVGAGGHAAEILKKGGELLGLEADPEMLEIAKKNLKSACPGFFCKLQHGNFRDLDQIAQEEDFSEVDGIVFDLGISTLHYKKLERGFSFAQRQEPLDMRLDPERQSVTAANLLNGLRKEQLTQVFAPVLGDWPARKLAQKIVVARDKKPLEKVGHFLEIIGSQRGKLHPATKAFLAVRMAVNSELPNLKEALPKAFAILGSKGRLVIITFNSLEDALVKSFFREMAGGNQAKLVTKKPILPGVREIENNPSARSAKLRVLEKI
jgi:16S rRNA (cytosine1402-N4)-methyltransferase